jgi:hypothetical protein
LVKAVLQLLLPVKRIRSVSTVGDELNSVGYEVGRRLRIPAQFEAAALERLLAVQERRRSRALFGSSFAPRLSTCATASTASHRRRVSASAPIR